MDALEKGKVHAGELSPEEFQIVSKDLEKYKNINIYSDQMNGVVFLLLNIRSEKFKNQNIRSWVYKTIADKFNVSGTFRKFTKKARQYFLPGGKGHLSSKFLDKKLSAVPLGKVDGKLLEKFKMDIVTTPSMRSYLPGNIESHLKEILQAPVSISYNVDGNYEKFIEGRRFEAHLMAASMSYKVLSEALNLKYNSKPPEALDPSGKVRELLAKYQREDDPEEEKKIIGAILEQMIDDAEIIPLFFFSGPMFIDNKVLSGKEMHFSESFQIWKLRQN